MKIYIIKCVESNKFYVGKTVQEGEKRFRAHFSEARNKPKNECKLLNQAIRKYGEDSFTFHVIKTVEDETELDTLEEKYIKIFNSLVPNGYNLTSGGEGCRASQETKERMSKWQKGKPKSEKHKEAMKNYASNRPKEHNENLAKSIRKRCVGSKASLETRMKMVRSRSKIKYEDIPIVLERVKNESRKDVAKDYDVKPDTISRIVRGWRPTGWKEYLESISSNDD